MLNLVGCVKIAINGPRYSTVASRSIVVSTHGCSKLLFFTCTTRSAPKTFNLDIAMVKLVRPVRFNNHVNVICLPSKDDKFPPGTVCVTAGWGHVVEGGSSLCSYSVHTIIDE